MLFSGEGRQLPMDTSDRTATRRNVTQKSSQRPPALGLLESRLLLSAGGIDVESLAPLGGERPPAGCRREFARNRAPGQGRISPKPHPRTWIPYPRRWMSRVLLPMERQNWDPSSTSPSEARRSKSRRIPCRPDHGNADGLLDMVVGEKVNRFPAKSARTPTAARPFGPVDGLFSTSGPPAAI